MYSLSGTHLLCRCLFNKSPSLPSSPNPPSPHTNHIRFFFYWNTGAAKDPVTRRAPGMQRPREWIPWYENLSGVTKVVVYPSQLSCYLSNVFITATTKSFICPSMLKKSSANSRTLVFLLEISNTFPWSVQSLFRDFLPYKLQMFIWFFGRFLIPLESPW